MLGPTTALARPEFCNAVLHSDRAGEVSVASDQGLNELFPGDNLGAPRVMWRPPGRGTGMVLQVGYEPGQDDEYGGRGKVGRFGPTQGGSLRVMWPPDESRDDVVVTLKDHHGKTWAYSGDQLKWGAQENGLPIFDILLPDKGQTGDGVVETLRTTPTMTAEVRHAGKLVQTTEFDLTGIRERNRFIARAFRFLKRHDPLVCSGTPAPAARP